jgi:hypothetical protein
MRLLPSILFAVVYTTGYVFLSLLSTGGGHGNFISLLPIPTWIFNFAALFLLARLDRQIVRVFFVVMMLTYYFLNSLLLLEASDDKYYFTNFTGLIVPALWHLAGQAIMWAVFVREVIKSKSDEIS